MRAWTNARQVAIKLASASQAMDRAVQGAIQTSAALLETKVKRHASGRPGPNVVTGDYRRSISRAPIPNGWAVGTNAAQGRRLELGFVGTDSLGRVYDQPPYPHFGPAVDEEYEEIEQRVRAALGGSLK